MSYILDALRKADAERERGAVPGIHAQPLAAMLPADATSRRGGLQGLSDGTRRWLIGGLAAGLLLLLALLLVRTMAPPTDGRSFVDAPVAAGAPAPVADRSPFPATQSAQPSATSVDPFAAAVPTPSHPGTEPPALAPPAPHVFAGAPSYRPVPAAPSPARPGVIPVLPGSARAPTAALQIVPAPSGPNRVATAGTASSATSAASTAVTAEPPLPATADRIYQTRELPEDIRRELPALTVGGATYSENAASRMLIINGQVFHENDKLAPDLVLERIQLRSAVLRYKGLRYSIAY